MLAFLELVAIHDGVGRGRGCSGVSSVVRDRRVALALLGGEIRLNASGQGSIAAQVNVVVDEARGQTTS